MNEGKCSTGDRVGGHIFESVIDGAVCNCGLRVVDYGRNPSSLYPVYPVGDGRCPTCRFPIDDHEKGACPRVNA